MNKKHHKYIIIGAGISGLTSAYQLIQKGKTEFIILEGRNRIGGRVLTKGLVDFGPAWFQDNHENLKQLLQNLGLRKFNQYTKGKSIFVKNTISPAHYFESDQTQSSAHRISGGTEELISALSENFLDKIKLNTIVTELIDIDNILNIFTNNETYSAEKVIITLPPKLANQLNFKPELPEQLNNAMVNTHTWMSNAIKVGLTFKTPFWRTKGLSGTVIGQNGPVTELYDHCNSNNTAFSLMGFVNENLRDISAENRKELILNYLENYLGKEIKNFISYLEKDWYLDQFTTSNNLKEFYGSPNYGNPIFRQLYMSSKLIFSGTETSPYFGGYLEGAVISGVLSAEKLLNTDI
jgi:monoamine oxidase